MTAARALTPAEAAGLTPALMDLAIRAKGVWGYDDAFLASFRDSMLGPFDAPGSTVLVAEPESDVAVEPDAADADVEVDDSAEKYNKS